MYVYGNDGADAAADDDHIISYQCEDGQKNYTLLLSLLLLLLLLFI